jgi:hypothetical protein
VNRLNFAYPPWSWRFADQRRPGNRRIFSPANVKKILLYGMAGSLLLRDVQYAEQMLSGTFFEADYASLLVALAWEAMGRG